MRRATKDAVALDSHLPLHSRRLLSSAFLMLALRSPRLVIPTQQNSPPMQLLGLLGSLGLLGLGSSDVSEQPRLP